MSYFVFGLMDLLAGDEAERAKACASAEGLNLRLGEDVRVQILTDMLGTYSPTTSIPFLLTKSLKEDTSDSLISPYVVGVEASAEAFATIGRWLVALLRSPKVEHVRVWMTEGYDSSFEYLTIAADRFAYEVARRVMAENDVPSLQVSVLR